MAVKAAMLVLGFMTGTSLDAVDMAVLDTDGEKIFAFGPAGERKLSDATRSVIQEATRQAVDWPRDAPEPAIFRHAADMVAEEHFAAAEAFLQANDLSWPDFDLVGFHGQTVLHERPSEGRAGRSVQLGDAEALAKLCGRSVVFDFRSADIAAGGQGAPLAPIYHLARARFDGLSPPLAVLNLGGVANLTLWTDVGDFTAFDTGPGNGMLDRLVQTRGAGRFDVGGNYASVGRPNDAVVSALLANPFFSLEPPKSLDRNELSLDLLEPLQLEDAAATLVALTAESVGLALDRSGASPRQVIVTGGGRHNPQIMTALAARLGAPVVSAEEVGWRGDAIEAEAMAFLAARVQRGLPISFPKTTGVARPMTGGRIVRS